MHYRFENCVVDKVKDGDTIVVTIDVGFYIKTTQSFRLFRINAPETRTRDLKEKKRGLMSKVMLQELIEGKQVILTTHKAGKYGRWLAEVEYGGRNINDLLVQEGHAEYKDY